MFIKETLCYAYTRNEKNPVSLDAVISWRLLCFQWIWYKNTLNSLSCKRMEGSGPESIALVFSYKGKIPWKFHYDRIIFSQVSSSHSQNTFNGLFYINGLTNRHKNWYDAIPHRTKHAPKVSTRSVKHSITPREVAEKKRQQDGRTHRRIVHNFFRWLYNPNRSHLKFDILHDANTSMGHGSNMGHGSKFAKNTFNFF